LLFLYNLFIWIYPKAAWILGLFNPKAKEWHLGRKGLLSKLSAAFTSQTKPVIWMHCASLGEFEQGRPVLEQLKLTYPNYSILLTFFSPSGYEVHKNYSGADFVFYLPMDGSKNARQFLKIVKPSLAIFVKYEFWHYYLRGLQAQEITTLLIAGVFRKEQLFFKWYGLFYKNLLHTFTAFFLQDNHSQNLLASVGVENNVHFGGDTRFDRVIEIAEKFTTIEPIAQFCKNSQVIVAGSTWIEDDEIIATLVAKHPSVKFIIAPHNITEQRLKICLGLYKNAILYSNYLHQLNDTEAAPQSFNTLILDNIGMLSRIYHYATISYIGGGFSADGIHNCLEAAVYHKPVLFGPVYDKYIEAIGLIDAGGAVSVDDPSHFESAVISILRDDVKRNEMGANAGKFVQAQKGAAARIIDYIQENRLLTN